MYDQWSEIWRISPLPEGNKVLQLTAILRQLITEGKLSPGQKVPPIRVLARKLNLGHGTVKRAYDVLQEESVLVSKHSLGTFVSTEKQFTIDRQPVIWPDQSPYSYCNHSSVFCEAGIGGYINYISAGSDTPDLSFLPAKSMLNYLQAAIDEYCKNPLTAEQYKERISTGLSERLGARDIIVREDQMIVIPYGRALQMVAATLIRSGDCFVMSSAADIPAQCCFRLAGAQLAYTDIDEQGMDLDRLEVLCKERTVKGIFLRSTVDFPYNVTITEERRVRLIELAKQYHFVIVSLEEDHELWFKRPLSPLVRRQHDGRVIHISPISKLSGELKSNEVVVASSDFIMALSSTLKAHHLSIDPTHLPLLFRFTTTGLLSGLIKRIMKEYKTKRDSIEILFDWYLGEDAQIKLPDAGLSVWILFKWRLNAADLVAVLEKHGFYDLAFIRSYENTHPVSALRLGFGSGSIESYEALFKEIPAMFIKP